MFARTVFLTALLFFSAVTSQVAVAQSYPFRPIKVVVPFPAGNASDLWARTLFDSIQKKTGATIIIENRAGALGLIGTRSALRDPADGYTLMMSGASTHALAEAFTKEVGYDPITDFNHLAVPIKSSLLIIVAQNSPFKTIQDLISEVKETPNKLTRGYASGSTWVAGAKFHKQQGLEARAVPYKASQDALNDLLGDRLSYLVTDSTVALSAVSGGQARALLVLGDSRYAGLPETPSLRDAGLASLQLEGFAGVTARAGIPDEARQWIKKAVDDAIADKSVHDALLKLGADVATPGIDATKFVADQHKLWSEAAKDAGVTPQ
ncbi:Bug family tripartite tricarboxylate transporter substrate binding protein [Sinorhizobium medicae]|uniref:Bug family tripartite tricarboxylate transporter substrate binding protein n=1 Tax=Sinorhizobium medicae TaxID=110321 RepID=UPI000FD99431|nr:tripartite tricarboxylate transporter substrate binding protein [Sinorhizobium medicae]RVO73537.1 tripartite tricarboxylate transporter substrate binding protein [Sinorhizobium medicae]